jgi:hypothetical protein
VPLTTTRPVSRLRRSLKLSVGEGLAAEIVGACSGSTVLTGWALFVRASPMTLGLIVALPQLAQFVQIPAAWITSRWGSRRTAMWAVGLSRQSLLLLCPLPWLPRETQESLLIAVAAVSTMLAVIGNNAWVTWMGDLVPRGIRGRYFGSRTAVTTVGAAVGTIGAGAFLDLLRRHGREGLGLALLALTGALAGLVASWLMRQQQPSQEELHRRPSVRDLIAPLRHENGRRLIAFQVTWNAAVGLAASFFTVYMLRQLQMSYVAIAVYGAVTSTTKVVFAPRWGRTIDRLGARPVVIVCSFAISAIPFLWLKADPHQLWPIAVDAIATGLFWGGQNQALFQLPLAVAPSRGRAWHLAVFSTAAGLTFALATTFGGWLVGQAPASMVIVGHEVSAYQALFALSGVARLMAATLSLRLIEPRAEVAWVPSPLGARRLLVGLFRSA